MPAAGGGGGGGGPPPPAVVAAFKILDSDPKVEGILVNIFGGIVNCATVAQGIIDAAEAVWGGSPKVPLVVRLQGNNVEGAMRIMEGSSVKCILGNDLDDAAQKVVAAVANK
uniref:ATP-citrate synthase/succinyl-CoA ligase C-terminal domain-containing protein n=1 Tax=Hemiselmis tepida TaxID=464990 RepID=A0A7S0YQC3_9CRYP